MKDEKSGVEDFPAELKRLKRFIDRIHLAPSVFVLSAALALGVAVFEGIIIGLLIPLVKGIITMDFGFVRDIPVLKALLVALSSWVTLSNGRIFIALVTLIFAASITKNILQYASSLCLAFQIRRFSSNARKLIFGRCLTFGKLYFDRTNAGYLHGVLMNFINTVAYRLTDLQQILVYGFSLLAYLVMMFVISWRLSLFVLLIFPILNFSLSRLIERIKTMSKSYSDAQADMSRRISNILSCMLIVKSYAQEDKEKDRFTQASDYVERYEFSIDKRYLLVIPLQEIIVLSLILLLISAMAFMVSRQGAASVPGFLIYFYVIRRAANAFGVINTMKASFATISGPVSELQGMLEDEGKFLIPEGGKEFTGLERGIEFRGLNHSYADGTPVLKEVGFTVEKGKMTAIVGPSGSGKTTLISLLTRFYDCPPATIKIDGTDIRDFKPGSVRAKIALVNQETLLFNDSIKANLIYGLDGRIAEKDLIAATKKARLHGFISRLTNGWETNIGDRGVQLSGGEKQRLSIARAILKNAEVLILDEATSSLDTRTEKLIQAAIDEVIENKTAIVIAHRLSTIKKADKIVVIEDGRVVETGSLDDLIQDRGKFYQYWEEQKFF